MHTIFLIIGAIIAIPIALAILIQIVRWFLFNDEGFSEMKFDVRDNGKGFGERFK